MLGHAAVLQPLSSGCLSLSLTLIRLPIPRSLFLSPTDPPAVEPTFLEIRQGQGRSITMSCRVLRAYPTRVLTYEWRLGSKLLRTGQFDMQDSTEYTVSSLSRDSYGIYNCNIINEAGAGRCSFLVTGRLGGVAVCRDDGLNLLQACGSLGNTIPASTNDLPKRYIPQRRVVAQRHLVWGLGRWVTT